MSPTFQKNPVCKRDLRSGSGRVNPTRYGVKVDLPAVLVAGEWQGLPAVEVRLSGSKVGSIASADATDLRSELLTVSPSGQASAKGRIEAGFEGGDYCVKLSLARPLRERPS